MAMKWMGSTGLGGCVLVTLPPMFMETDRGSIEKENRFRVSSWEGGGVAYGLLDNAHP